LYRAWSPKLSESVEFPLFEFKAAVADRTSVRRLCPESVIRVLPPKTRRLLWQM
jgi:hypothetical protein